MLSASDCYLLMALSDRNVSLGARPARILIADDHEVMRLGIRNLLESVSNWTVSGEASTGREAVELALESPPDVIIMDITMPELNGLEAAAKIAEHRPDIYSYLAVVRDRAVTAPLIKPTLDYSGVPVTRRSRIEFVNLWWDGRSLPPYLLQRNEDLRHLLNSVDAPISCRRVVRG